MKKAVNILLSFFMAVIIFAFGAGLTGTIITSAPYVKSVIGLSSYINKAETEIAESLQSVAIPSGLPEDFFDDKIHTDFIKKVINDGVNAALSGKSYEMPTEEIEELIYKDIVAYAEESGTQLNEEAHTMLKNTAELSATYYKNYTYNIFYRALKYLKGISTKLLIISAVLLAVLAFMIYLLKDKKEFCYALLGGGIMLLLPLVFIITGGAFKWSIASVALLSFVNTFIGVAIGIMILLGAVSLLFGIRKTKRFLKE